MSISSLSRATPLFDLYDFFSVLIPGAGFVMGLYPFLPAETDAVGAASLILLAFGGYIAGRGLHYLSVLVDGFMGVVSHRELFAQQVANPTIVPQEVADRFYIECQLAFGNVGMLGSRRVYASTPEKLEYLYPFVRGYVHLDGRSRSRTFQAIHAFFRSAFYGFLILTTVYILYAYAEAVFSGSTLVSTGVFPYQTKLAALAIPPWFIIVTATGAAWLAIELFWGGRQTYRRLYVEYLITDFVVVRSADE